MSRFSGPQRSGATRELDVRRRAEAETRQAAEAARDKAREAAQGDVRPLTEAEVADLFAAVRAAEMARILNDLSRLEVGYRPGIDLPTEPEES